MKLDEWHGECRGCKYYDLDTYYCSHKDDVMLPQQWCESCDDGEE